MMAAGAGTLATCCCRCAAERCSAIREAQRAAVDLAASHNGDADADPWLCYAICEREAAELQEMLRQLHQRGEG